MDELEKLFAEASASVMKATAPRKEPEATPAPVAEPVVPVVAATPPPEPTPAVAPARPAAPAAAGGTYTVTSGTQTDAHLTLEVDGTPRDLPWAGCHLALGRVGTVQMVGVKYGAHICVIPQDKVNFKALVKQLQPDTVGNWRRLVVELAERITSVDAGVQAITSGGGMIPKYATVEAFVDHIRAGG